MLFFTKKSSLNKIVSIFALNGILDMETIKRILQERITNRIEPGKAVLIFGARRVGKTVLMRKIVDGYSGRIMMLNGEDYDTLALT